MKKYLGIKKVKEILGVTSQTLRNWDKNGRLKPHHTTESGYRFYSENQINELIQNKEVKRDIIGYCRVSSQKQYDDLNRQIENVKLYLLSQGKPFKIITDIGSGINYNKSGLLQLLELVNNNRVEKIVILYKDRLLRIGFELFNNFCKLHNTEIEIIDNTEKSEQEELTEDLIQIITVFSCKLQGKRAKTTKKMIKELVKEDDLSEKEN